MTDHKEKKNDEKVLKERKDVLRNLIEAVQCKIKQIVEFEHPSSLRILRKMIERDIRSLREYLEHLEYVEQDDELGKLKKNSRSLIKVAIQESRKHSAIKHSNETDKMGVTPC